MTRKHFILVANVVSEIEDENSRRKAALRFADEFADINPWFSRQRFLDACGVSE